MVINTGQVEVNDILVDRIEWNARERELLR